MSPLCPVLDASASLKSPQLFSTSTTRGSYIVSLASISPSTVAALATNSSESGQGNGILIYSVTPSGLSNTLTNPLSSGSTPTSMRAVRNFSGRPALISSHQRPGCLRVWDERKGSEPVVEFHSPKNASILSFDVSLDGLTLAAGTDLQSDDATIFYWDTRNARQSSHAHSSTHSDDITALRFHPTSPQLLLSASTDGLLNTSNAQEQDEDEAVQEVANWGCSIARAGWFSHGSDYRVWAASDMETFGLWNGELDALVNFGDIRQPTLPGQWTTDYLVDAYDYSRIPGPCDTMGLTIFLGSNSGDVAVASVSDAQPSCTIKGVLHGGHSDSVVRCILWDNDNDVLFTGDETGRLAAWRPSTDNDDVEMESAEPSKVGTKRMRDDDRDQVRVTSGSVVDAILTLDMKGMKRGRYEG